MPEMWERASVGKTVDKILSHWREIGEIVQERKATCGKSGFGGTGHNGVSDPTAKEAIRQADEITSITCSDGLRVWKPEMWLAVFRESYENLDGIMRDIMKRRYRDCESYVKTSIALNITDRVYYSIVDDIRSYVVMISIQHGLVKVR